MANSVLATSRVKTNQNIQVYLRVRPMNEREKSMRSQEAVEVASNREVIVKQDYRNVKKFTFDGSFGPESKQAAIYQSVVAPYIEEVLTGYNCTVFAYGQTGTGKTHTMIGEECINNSDLGIIPRAVNHLFDELRSLSVEFSMRISFLELYNEELSDLLSASDTSPIRIYDDTSKKGSIIVHGLEKLPVHSSSDVYKLLAKGQEKRKTASTLMNVQSSRSHTIFSILVHIREFNEHNEEMLKVGKLNLVDLAGSENISKAGNEKGIRTRETVNINQSLLTLGRVITALVERTPHIPYRESKLTRLLQESLGGRTKTSIIATVSPGHKDLEETLSTLEYAHRAKNIQNKPEVNQKLTKKLALKEYTEEIDKLKRDLQACRSKNGIYLAEESYTELTDRLNAQSQELSEKHLAIKVLKDEMVKIQNVFNEVNLNLVEKETELAATYETLHITQAELGQTANVLRKTQKRYQEKKQIVASHIQTETVLTAQAQELKKIAESASTDTYLLHDTIERRKLTDRNLVSVCDSFQRAMHSNINKMTANLDNFTKQMDIESKNVVEHIESSSARNAYFTSTILEKLSKQRRTCEMDTDNVKKLLHEKLTQEMSFTAKQMDLIESVVNQSIADERNFNERVSNEMLMSLLSLINEQSNELLAKETLISEMVNAQRTATSIFCEAQTSNLQTLSSDITELLQNCRKTVDISVTKNNRFTQDMAKLLEEWKSNSEDMNTISPTISQSVEMVRNAAKAQIEQIDSMNVDNEQRSNKLNIELSCVNSDIKRNAEANQSQISSIMKSVNDHSKLLAASLKSSKISIRQQFDEEENVAKQMIGDINSKILDTMQNVQSTATDITNDVHYANDKFQEDSRKHSNFNTDLSSTVEQFNHNSVQMLTDWQATLDNFHRNEIKTYSSSGATPAKREFNYPKVLAATSPHDRIIRRFWSEHNDSDLNISTTISEGNEITFMNELDEIQSSSMVQERIADRVLCEIQLPVSSPLVISNGHLKGPLPSSNVGNDELQISPIRAEPIFNEDPNESNKENL